MATNVTTSISVFDLQRIIDARVKNYLDCLKPGTGNCDCEVNTNDTDAITLSGDGSTGSPLTAELVLSPNEGNILEILSNGLYASADGSGGSGGGVTSVGLQLPSSVFTVYNSPVTGSSTLIGVFNPQAAGTFFAGPVSGLDTTPTFRALASDDIPDLKSIYWALTGNSGTTAGTNFLGTTDDIDLVFKRNNVQAGLLNTSLRATTFGVGTPTGLTQTDNTAFGYYALSNATSVYKTTAFGSYSLYSNTTGDLNTGIGSYALYSNTTGYQNTALGVDALYSNTSGTWNVAIGEQSIQYITAAYNTAVGFGSLRGVPSGGTGGLNTAVGFASMERNTTGEQNAALGMNSLLLNTEGIKNVAVGAGAMENNTTGSFNVGLGQDSLLLNTTGFRNIGIGWNGFANNAIGYENIGIGYGAGKSVTEGYENVFIGSFAGWHASQIATVTDSIAIGNDSYTTKDHQAVLGSATITETILRGILIDDTYGTGAITGTLAYLIGVDATGGFIEIDPSGVGGAQTWQETLIEGSTLSQANKVLGENYKFTMVDLATDSGLFANDPDTDSIYGGFTFQEFEFGGYPVIYYTDGTDIGRVYAQGLNNGIEWTDGVDAELVNLYSGGIHFINDSRNFYIEELEQETTNTNSKIVIWDSDTFKVNYVTIGAGLTLSSGVLDSVSGGSGTVTSVSFTDGNGFDGSVATATTTPAISLAVAAALDGAILYSNSGALTAVTVGSGLDFTAGTLTATGATPGIDTVLAEGEQLTTDRAIDANSNVFTISSASLINLAATEIRLNSTLAGTSNGYVWTLTDNSTGAGEWAAPAATPIPISSLLAATGDNSVDSLDNLQVWDWSTLSSGETAFTLKSEGNSSAVGGETVFSTYLSGNFVGYSARILNDATGDGNTALYAAVTDSGSNSYAIRTSGKAAIVGAFTAGNNSAFSVDSIGYLSLGNSAVGSQLTFVANTSGSIVIAPPTSPTSYSLVLPSVQASGTQYLQNDGSGNLSWATPAGTIDGSGTTNELTYWVDSDTLGALAVATYPNLTEISYVKGVTSAIQTQLDAKLENVVEDTTPQLGGNLDVNGQKIVSVSNGNIDIEPNGTGNVLLGNFTFDADQTVGAGQDNYVLTYDNGTGLISLEAAAGGSSVSFGADNQIPYTNGTTDDFDYSANFTFTGTAFAVDNSSFVFNESGADVDARWEGVGDANLLYLEATNARVGIGLVPATTKFEVYGGADGNALDIIRISSGSTRSATIGLYAADQMTFKNTNTTNNNAGFTFLTRQSHQMLYMTDAAVTFNASGIDTDHIIQSDTLTNAFILDGATGSITLGSLATGLTPPSSGGTDKMVTVDINGLLSWQDIPSGGAGGIYGGSGSLIEDTTVTCSSFDMIFSEPDLFQVTASGTVDLSGNIWQLTSGTIGTLQADDSITIDTPLLYATSLQTGGAAPSTVGDEKMVICDASGLYSFEDKPAGTVYDKYTLTANDTIDNPTGLADGQTYSVKILQSGAGSWTVTWDTMFNFSISQPEPTLSTDSGAIDIVEFRYDAGDDALYCIGQSLGFNQSP